MEIDLSTTVSEETSELPIEHIQQTTQFAGNSFSAGTSSPQFVYQSESSMNFDYLQGLYDAPMDGSSPSSSSSLRSAAGNTVYGHVDDSKALDRFVTILDRLDARVEMFRKDALSLQEKKDYLLTSMDLIKNHECLQMMSESDREEIMCYMQRVNARLGTVELNVRTVRDRSQEDSLSQINALIDTVIKMSDAIEARQRCKQYLNCCCSSTDGSSNESNLTILPETQVLGGVLDMDVGPVDKKFESALLGCTLDDQKTIKKRLQALMNYLNKQIIRD